MEEMMNGQKVIKVFCHEDGAKADFDKVNDELFENSRNANRYANILMPLLANLGNVTYVIVALVGGALLLSGAPNLSLSGMALSISIVVPFLNMTKQFAGAIGQVSNQVNMVVMGLAGAHRIFALLDEEPETTTATSPLSTRVKRPTAAWKNTPSAPTSGPGSTPTTTAPSPTPACAATSGSMTWTSPMSRARRCCTMFRSTRNPARRLRSSAPPAPARRRSPTSSNRFYDIADGKIRYDGININKIRKADLRRSLGIVLQDTNLFTGTVMENIRYGNLDAHDEECITAARLAGADDFNPPPARRLQHDADRQRREPQPGGASASCLPSPARPVADPPVMIMDEATSLDRYPHRGDCPARHGRPDDRPHNLRHRPPAFDGAERRRHHGAGPWPHH